MASDGNPPLPDTQDPFVLLGVDEDADEKTVKQAYARLIRQFRPDRAPAEFQRIQAAFEMIKGSRGGELHARHREPLRAFLHDLAPEPEAAPEIAEIDPDRDEAQRRVSDRLREAAAADSSAACVMIDALLDDEIDLELLISTEADVSLLVRHPALSWSRLRRCSRDLQAVAVVWELAWDHAFLNDFERAHRLLDDDTLRLDAADYPDLAEACLVRLGALSWKRTDALTKLLDVYQDALPSHPRVDWILDSVQLEVGAAISLKGTTSRPIAELVPVLLATRLGSAAHCKEAALALQAWLRSDIDGALSQLAQLQRSTDLGPLLQLLYEHLPISCFRLDALPKESFDRLTRILHKIGFQPRKWTVRAGVAAAGAGIATLIGVLPVALVVGGAGALFLATETWRFKRKVRPRLAKAILKTGVSSGVLSRWVQINGRLAGRLWRYEPAIDSDPVLYLFSMFAAAARTLGALDAD